MITLPRATYPPADRCIYCGVRDAHLQREHIVPFGALGRMVLPKASCQKCSRITTAIEQECLVDMLGRFRIRMGFPKRRGRERVRYYRLVSRDGRIIHLPAAQYPGVLILPQLPWPSILAETSGIAPIMWVHWDKEAFQATAERYSLRYITGATYHLPTFMRMIAKIGHAFASAAMPRNLISTMQLLLPGLILHSSQQPRLLVGGEMALEKPVPYGYNIQLWSAINESHEYLIAKIRLFSWTGAPSYHAVVGRRELTDSRLESNPVRL
jgi:hypothetical protein